MFILILDLLSSPLSNETTEAKSIVNSRILYFSCINEDAIEKDGVDDLISLINKELGGWPILQGSTWNESTFDLSRTLFKLSQYNKFVFFNVFTYIDEINSTAYAIYVSE